MFSRFFCSCSRVLLTTSYCCNRACKRCRPKSIKVKVGYEICLPSHAARVSVSTKPVCVCDCELMNESIINMVRVNYRFYINHSSKSNQTCTLYSICLLYRQLFLKKSPELHHEQHTWIYNGESIRFIVH